MVRVYSQGLPKSLQLSIDIVVQATFFQLQFSLGVVCGVAAVACNNSGGQSSEMVGFKVAGCMLVTQP